MKDSLLGFIPCCVGYVCYDCFGFSFIASLLVAAVIGGLVAAADYGIGKLKRSERND